MMALFRIRFRRLAFITFSSFCLVFLFFSVSRGVMDVRDLVILREYVARNVRQNQFIRMSPGHIACQRPVLPINNTDILKFFHEVDTLVCEEEPNWVTVSGSEAKIGREAIQRHGAIECSFEEIIRINDDEVELNTADAVKTTTSFTFTSSDFYAVSCKAADGKTWSSPLAGIGTQISPKKSNWKDISSQGMGVNVLALGIDSLSHNTFIRTLPKTYRYLTEVLGADVLNGYNIVGDGTTQALLPILTGRTELELPDTRKRIETNAQHVDVFPFIWKEFADAGFDTLFAEDLPRVGVFNYRMKGFKNPPTHHYMRPFHLHFDKEKNSHPKYCIRSKPTHQVFWDYIRNYMSTYKDSPVFAFSMYTELSHDDENLVSVADEDLVNQLKELKESGVLDRTLLMVFADHGHRFQHIRSSQQGKQEERLPFVSFVVPETLKQNYPAAYLNLKSNTDKLSTPFDIHETFKDILSYSGAKMGKTTNRGISLFSTIPSSRTCRDAFIEPHWCACLTWEPLQVTDERVREAAQALIHYINSHTAPYRGLCQEISLEKITHAAILLPTKGLMAFKTNKDMDGFIPDMRANTPIAEEVYELHVETYPGHARYEAALTYSIKKDTFTTRLSDVSRTNKYGDSSKCIANVNTDLLKYCVCR